MSERNFSLYFEDKSLYPRTGMLDVHSCGISNCAAAGNTDHTFNRLKI